MTGESPLRYAGTAVVLRDGVDGLETLLLRRPDTGSFPGGWVFPGGRVDPGDREGARDEVEAARRAAVREAHEEAGISIRDLRLLSWWTPPAVTPVRFRTWFFLARHEGEQVRPNPGEIVEAAWLTPAQIFARHERGEITLFPPTWVTLHGLRGHASVAEALSAVAEPVHYETDWREIDGRERAAWAGDEEHPQAPGPPGARHRLWMGPPPWTYERA